MTSCPVALWLVCLFVFVDCVSGTGADDLFAMFPKNLANVEACCRREVHPLRRHGCWDPRAHVHIFTILVVLVGRWARRATVDDSENGWDLWNKQDWSDAILRTRL